MTQIASLSPNTAPILPRFPLEKITPAAERRPVHPKQAPRPVKTTAFYNREAHLSFYERYGRSTHVYYWHERDLFVPGVTSVLKRLDKPMLLGWAAGCGAELMYRRFREKGTLTREDIKDGKSAHNRIRDDAADIGKLVHKTMEKLFRGEEIDLTAMPPEALKALNGAREWLDAHHIEVIEPERLLFSRKWFFAGQCDLFAHIDGKLTLLDFKTSSGFYIDHALQTAAYALAERENTGVRPEQRMIVRFDKKTGAFDVHTLPHSNRHEDLFLRLREFHELMTTEEKEFYQ